MSADLESVVQLVRRVSPATIPGFGARASSMSRSIALACCWWAVRRNVMTRALGFGSPVGAVAAPDFAVDDCRSDCLLASPVGGVDAVGGEEGEQRSPFVAEMFDQAAVGVTRVSLVDEQVETLTDVDGGRSPTLGDRHRGFGRRGLRAGDL